MSGIADFGASRIGYNGNIIMAESRNSVALNCFAASGAGVGGVAFIEAGRIGYNAFFSVNCMKVDGKRIIYKRNRRNT